MPKSPETSRTNRRLSVFHYGFLFLIFLLILFFLFIFVLPSIVSTEWSRRLIQEKISVVLDRPVTIQRLNWSWTDGIVISQFVIPDIPEFSDIALLSIDNIQFSPNIKKLFNREVSLFFRISRLDLHIVKNQIGAYNIERLLEIGQREERPSASEKKKADKTDPSDKKPLALPSPVKDIIAKIQVEKVNLAYIDRAKAETYRITDLSCSLNAASVKTEKIEMKGEAGIEINGHALPRSTVSLSVDNLFNEDGALTMEKVSVLLDANIPGIIAKIDGDLSASRIDAGIQMDLKPIMDAATPLIPDFPSPTDIHGRVECQLTSGIDPGDPLAFHANVSGSDLAVSGSLMNGQSVGPGSFQVDLQGVLDMPARKLDLNAGEFRILEKSRARATATVDRITDDNPKIRLTLTDMILDLDELTSFAQPFFPSKIDIKNMVGEDAYFSLTELDIDGETPKGNIKVEGNGIGIQLPQSSITQVADNLHSLQITGSRMDMENFTVYLSDLFPTAATFSLSLKVDRLTGKMGKDTIFVSGFNLQNLIAKAEKINRIHDSRFGMAGNFLVNNKLYIEQMRFSDLMQINDMQQTLATNADLLQDESIRGALPNFDISFGNVVLKDERFGPIQTGLRIGTVIDNIAVSNVDPIRLELDDCKMNVALDKAMDLHLTADVTHSDDTRFDAEAAIDADIQALMSKFPNELLDGISGKGKLKVSCRAKGRQPHSHEIQALPEMRWEDHLSFMDRLDMDVHMKDGAFALSLPDTPPAAVRSINGRPLIRYRLDGNTGKGKITSSVATGAVTGLPGIDPDQPVSGRFSLSATHEYANTLDVSQSLTFSPIGMEEKIDITIDGLDRAIRRGATLDLHQLFSTVGARVSGQITIPESSMIKKLGITELSGTDISGFCKARMKFQLIPNRSIGGSISLFAQNVDLNLPEIASVTNMDANMNFLKSYVIRFSDRTPPVSKTPGLSTNVMDTGWLTEPTIPNSGIFRHIRQVHERMNPDPTLSFQTAEIMATPFPLQFAESILMMNVNDGLPNLDYFRFDLLGGSINGSIAVVHGKRDKGKDFRVTASLSFSGIDAARIFPEAFPGDDHLEADVSGAIHADFPFTERLRPLLENGAVTIDFTRIGARALERLLYALDPYESNEAIVSQRQLLKIGSPKHFHIGIKDGFFTLQGEVTVKGVDISMPRVRRLNIARIPGMDRFEENLAVVEPAISILHTLSAKTIVFNKNKVSFR